MLPKVFAIYHRSTETFQVLQTELDADGSIARLKNWSRPSLRDWSSTPVEKRDELVKWSKGHEWFRDGAFFGVLRAEGEGGSDGEVAAALGYPPAEAGEWYVCKTNKALSDSDPPIYKDRIHGKNYHFWFLNHMLVWSNYKVYRSRRDASKEAWMKSPMIPVLEFATKQLYPRTNTGFYTYWSETTKDEVETVSEAGRDRFAASGQMDDSMMEHIDPRYLRIRTPSPREEDMEEGEVCCESKARQRGRSRGFSDMADSVDEHIEGLCGSKTFTQQASIVVLLMFIGLWSGSVLISSLSH